MNPDKSIVPILAIGEYNSIKYFLGTGVFIVRPRLLATAEHVVRDWNGPLAVTTPLHLDQIFRANILSRSSESDLVLLEVPQYPFEDNLQLAEDEEIITNHPVVCMEYGTTRTLGNTINFSPATRLGNVTRVINIDRFGKAGKDALELSFPALRGASGSPVLSNINFHLWGIMIANVSYHLLPSQIETVLDEKNNIMEETKFMLPQAIAINVKHLREMILILLDDEGTR